MDLLKRNASPINDIAWEEIDDQARDIFNTNLTARRFVDVEGPKGFDYSAVNLGKLNVPDNQDSKEVMYGIRKVSPLIETRIIFELDLWELDNIARGDKDPDLGAVEEAAKKMAHFEDKAIYNGFKAGNIIGIDECVEHKISITKIEDYPEYVSEAIIKLKQDGIEGPYSLVINPIDWNHITKYAQAYPLRKRITELVSGEPIISTDIKGAYVVSLRGGDYSLTLGQDLSIGYESHTGSKVRLFMMETFAFNIYESKAIIKISE
ncbi:MAG: family 1 encapsulin nanocompartment shell protein [Spirochaetota bacterium]